MIIVPGIVFAGYKATQLILVDRLGLSVPLIAGSREAGSNNKGGVATNLRPRNTSTEIATTPRQNTTQNQRAADGDVSQPLSNGPSSAPTSSTGQAAPAAVCSNTDIPAEACHTIRSVESQGIKDNQYITFDTGQIPDGAQAAFNLNSWSSTENEKATIGATVQTPDYSSVYVIIYMQKDAGVWKLTSYRMS